MDGYRVPTIGLLLGSGLIAGIMAYAISRISAREERQSSAQMVMERARDFNDSEAARVGREFVSEKVVPEMKPMLLDLLKDAEEYVDRYFKQAEKAVKSM